MNLENVTLKNGFRGLDCEDGFRSMVFVFNDRMFDDGWAEPFVVHMKINTRLMTADFLADRLRQIGSQLYNDGVLECSEDGVNQIMNKFKQLYPGFEAEWIVFRCPCVPFGHDVEDFNYDD